MSIAPKWRKVIFSASSGVCNSSNIEGVASGMRAKINANNPRYVQIHLRGGKVKPNGAL
jgi:hypothetical protein